MLTKRKWALWSKRTMRRNRIMRRKNETKRKKILFQMMTWSIV
jgi:hypothetical protein